MNFVLTIFVLTVVFLVGLLFWAIRPAPVSLQSADEVFEVIAGGRHYYRLPQILSALNECDTEFLTERNHSELARQLRADRKRIALEFLNLLEVEYQTLMAAARALTAMAPDVLAGEELQRLKLSVLFGWKCFSLRFRLRTGLRPWAGFTQLSHMTGQISYRLESATRQIADRALAASEFSLPFEDGSGNSR